MTRLGGESCSSRWVLLLSRRWAGGQESQPEAEPRSPASDGPGWQTRTLTTPLLKMGSCVLSSH